MRKLPRMPARSPLAEADFAVLADFRYQLRRFLHFSSEAVQAAGLTPTQHQALLAIKAAPAGQSLSIGDLAERLQVRHHSAVGLVDRLTNRHLVKRLHLATDRRKVGLKLTAQGERLIARLSSAHHAELKAIAPALSKLLRTITAKA